MSKIEQQSEAIKEQEPKPKVLVTFSGREHTVINLEDLINYRRDLLKHLQGSSRGQRIVLKEGSDMTSTSTQIFKKGDKQFGGYCNRMVAGILRRQFKVEPNKDSVKKRRSQIESTDLYTAISTSLLPSDSVHTFYETRMLDEVKKEKDFKLEYEQHAENVSKTIVDIYNQFLQIQIRAINRWKRGDFREIIADWKNYYQLDLQGNRIREKDLNSYLEAKIKRLISSPKGGSIFIPFGDNHYIMIKDLARRFHHDSSVIFNIERHSDKLGIYDRIIASQGVDAVDDVFFAQELLGRLLMQDVTDRLLNLGKASLLANNYETIFSTMNQIAESFSLEEIKSICENKTNLLKLAQNHPLIGSLSDLIPTSYFTTQIILPY